MTYEEARFYLLLQRMGGDPDPVTIGPLNFITYRPDTSQLELSYVDDRPSLQLDVTPIGITYQNEPFPWWCVYPDWSSPANKETDDDKRT